jgi:hypothetical protein
MHGNLRTAHRVQSSIGQVGALHAPGELPRVTGCPGDSRNVIQVCGLIAILVAGQQFDCGDLVAADASGPQLVARQGGELERLVQPGNGLRPQGDGRCDAAHMLDHRQPVSIDQATMGPLCERRRGGGCEQAPGPRRRRPCAPSDGRCGVRRSSHFASIDSPAPPGIIRFGGQPLHRASPSEERRVLVRSNRVMSPASGGFTVALRGWSIEPDPF